MSDCAHQTVLLHEAVAGMQPRAGGRYADCNVGGAGHSELILELSSPTGWLAGFDLDGTAISGARQRLARFAGRFELYEDNFERLAERVEAASLDGVVMDLGLSSMELGDASRGFSFQEDGPLDMRYGASQEVTAAALVNGEEGETLARWFWELGGEVQARRIARAVVADRQARPFTTTRQLASLIERVAPRSGSRLHPATKVFQALRMVVNRELESLGNGLAAALTVLKRGGRLSIITFHSGEVRLVREWARRESRSYEVPGDRDIPELRQPREPRIAVVTRKAVVASADEQAANPRSRSAQLRVYEKL